MIIENLYGENTSNIPKYNVIVTLYANDYNYWDQNKYLKIEKLGGYRLQYKFYLEKGKKQITHNINLAEGKYILNLNRELVEARAAFEIYLEVNGIIKLLATNADLTFGMGEFNINIDNYNTLPVDNANIKNLTVDKIMFKGHENIPLSIYEHKKFDGINSLSLGNKILATRYFENNNKSTTKTANPELTSLFFSYPFKK